jgi:glycosyltransferase involved in cell wall biosynthesis
VEKAPQVSVLVAVHNGAPFLLPALRSISRQTVSDFELVVVDDASTDSTPTVLAALDDPRLRVVRTEARRGLAGALNRGLDEVRGRYVARMDADDVAFPHWLERVLARLGGTPKVALVGAGVLELHPGGRLGAAHVPQPGLAVTRWHAHFGASPFFHNTVAFDIDLLRRHGLRYDESFGESEDFELWTRVLAHAEADSLEELLVLYRLHPEQASQRRAALQQDLGRRIALAQIAATAPTLSEVDVDLAWRFGFHRELNPADVERAAAAYVELVRRFSASGRYSRDELAGVREAAARVIVRRARAAPGAASARLLREALALDPALVLHGARRRARRAELARSAGHVAVEVLGGAERNGAPIRVAAVFPEPTPYRTPLLDRVAALEEIELEVVYAAPSVVSGRTWAIEREHRATVLRGLRAPGGERVFRHDYPITPGIERALRRARPDVVVVSGWSTFAAQAAIAWCRLRGTPYVLVVESHDEGPRAGWRRTIKRAVVPPLVGGAAGILVTGTLARTSMIARGAHPEQIRVFANTVDVDAFGERVARLADLRPELRARLGAGPDDVVVLSVARLGPEKRHDVLLRAAAAAGEPRLLVVLAGDGQEREPLEALGRELGVRLVLVGDVEWERIVELYAAADVFALLSERETWGVVVNEAAACGLPLVLSDRVGAAHDLLRDGENGVLLPAGDVDATARALADLATDAGKRRAMAERSRELARDWGYGPSIDGFLAAVREALADRR